MFDKNTKILKSIKSKRFLHKRHHQGDAAFCVENVWILTNSIFFKI